jgi:hypothetical protein
VVPDRSAEERKPEPIVTPDQTAEERKPLYATDETVESAPAPALELAPERKAFECDCLAKLSQCEVILDKLTMAIEQMSAELKDDFADSMVEYASTLANKARALADTVRKVRTDKRSHLAVAEPAPPVAIEQPAAQPAVHPLDDIPDFLDRRRKKPALDAQLVKIARRESAV